MKVINSARPFNVGDEIVYLRFDDQDVALDWTRVRVASWMPGISVNAHDARGRSVTIGWNVATGGLVGR